ncbi:unnamed protein product [[Actinomadura] parvosata subsp. kistnae]|uniref:XRE family transcriptional regulator n=1 Tax=[Actinomadura] parvosata subsp. kistnae TaxID=1909395 RepID=A0A1U9ZY95_9ACTN|nr:helix-turn-helix transcriptional regulator [Nonomuraea sp. ATCC 55076]AQZ62931.1 XRE family transcriptional regulator [Nonomuraea sp. ATCC 55076]SPL95826.1 unnamed protein product [Actinomadura parvosata subsp. kistnae]
MTAKLDYEWRLREIMAARGMFNTTDLRPLLIERGITLSATQIWRLVTEKPERLSVKVLVALIDILGCPMEDLITPVVSPTGSRNRAAGQTGAVGGEPGAGRESGVGGFRPKRARITE